MTDIQPTKYDMFNIVFDMYNEGRIDFEDATKRFLRSLGGFAIDSSDLDTDDQMWPFQ